jgi:diaminopropionate ammonia-lyase
MLSRLADGFMTITDAEAQAAAARLIALGADVSPCGAAGAAGLIALAAQPDIRRSLGLDPRSRVLLIGTEAGEAPTQGPKP